MFLGLPAKRLKALLLSSILAKAPAHLCLLDLVMLTILGGIFSTPHSHLFCSQIFASGSCFQILVTWIPPLM